MTFQASDYKGNNFLDLVNDNNLLIRPAYLKEEAWLKHLRHFNSLYVQATRAITNHIFIDEYCLRFSPREPFE